MVDVDVAAGTDDALDGERNSMITLIPQYVLLAVGLLLCALGAYKLGTLALVGSIAVGVVGFVT